MNLAMDGVPCVRNLGLVQKPATVPVFGKVKAKSSRMFAFVRDLCLYSIVHMILYVPLSGDYEGSIGISDFI